MGRRQPFLNIRTEGALLPSDLLSRLLEGANIPGLMPEDYHLGAGEKLNEAISRSWARLLGLWAAFRKSQVSLPPTDLGTTLTREKWLLQLFQELGYGRLIAASPFELDGKTYPISHLWHGQHYSVPVHLVSLRAELDKRSEQRIQGATKASPHGLVQEFLNRSEHNLWAFVSNGLRLRILRDNASLTRQAYVEFDLEGIFEGEAYADFRLLWMLGHQSRVEGTTKDRPETCWLEAWSKQAQTDGRRALDHLRDGVEKALNALGTGFIAHKNNQDLRNRLKAGALQKGDYYRQLLRLIYRLIFLFVAEDRDLLHVPGTPVEARSRYARFYSGQRLRRMAERSRGSLHSDLWLSLRLVFQKLGCDSGCPELGLPALGGFLFGPEALADLESSDISNEHMLMAIRFLGLVRDRSGWRLVDYRNLGSEELGSIYESLLELSPTMELEAGAFSLATVSGSERKTTGSYYTPESLIQCLLGSTLDPVLKEASAKPNPEASILALKVCDPACGSGHFLIAAAHRIANSLAGIRTGEEAPSPESIRTAVRDVIGHCLFGIDLNPMAVELCKVSLWLEALEPGKPLSFLDAHIQCGNSLLGATPALIAQGLPDDAFTALEGDDKAVVSDLKKRNKKERTGTGRQKHAKAIATPLFSGLGTSYGPMIDNLSREFELLEAVEDSTLAAIHAKESRFKAMHTSEGWKHAKLVADAWCAAFVWEKTKVRLDDEEGAVPITHDDIQRIIESPILVSIGVRNEIERLSECYRFLHPHIAFPHVFQSGEGVGDWAGGFDVVLGNPPWERIKIQEKEWFAAHDEGITNAPNAAIRKRMILALKESGSLLYAAFARDLRQADGETHVVRDSGRFPLCGRGDINTYSVFTELSRSLINHQGRVGLVIPSGIATDDTTKYFFGDLVKTQSLVSLFDFVNDSGLFPGVGHGRQKFCLITMAGADRLVQAPEFFFYAQLPEDLEDESRRFTLSTSDIQQLNPNTGTCAIFRSKIDAELTKAIYRRVPILIREGTDEVPEENPWQLSFLRMLDMATDSGSFRTAEALHSEGWIREGNIFKKDGAKCLPMVEAKMLHHFTHRWGDYAMRPEGSLDTELPRISEETLADPSYVVRPRYWVFEREVKLRCAELPKVFRTAYLSESEDVLRVGLGYWAFGNWLLRRGMKNLESAMKMLFPEWVEFVKVAPWARHLEPTQLGICGNSEGHFKPIGPHYLPSAGLEEMVAEDNKGCFWYEAQGNLVHAMLQTAGADPLDEAEWIAFQTLTEVMDLGEWVLEHRTPKWLLGWRDITNTTNERTVIASVLPRAGVGDTFLLMFSKCSEKALLAALLANLDSFVLDFLARQKVGGTHLKYHVFKQLAVLPPHAYTEPAPWVPDHSIKTWVLPRVLELVFTAWDLTPFAQDCGHDSPPFIWNEDRRFLLRCELDAAFFHLYGLNREEVAYVMDTFPIVRRKDEANYGKFRTKDSILAIYDSMSEAIRTGKSYLSSLEPGPASPECCHPAEEGPKA